MASAPQASNLPLFYNDLMPLNSQDHASWNTRTTDKAPWLNLSVRAERGAENPLLDLRRQYDKWRRTQPK